MKHGIRERARFFSFVILIPLLLTATGAWEIDRNSTDLTGLVHAATLVSRIRMACGLIAVAGGGLSLSAGLYGILLARWGATKALASRDDLVATFARVAASLPTIFGTMVAGLCVAVSGIVLSELGGLWFLQTAGILELRVLVLGLALAAGMIWVAARTLLDLRKALIRLVPEPSPMLGRVLTRDAAPGLWNFVSGIASRVHGDMPDHIMIGLTQGFFVTSSALQPIPADLPAGPMPLQGRTLYLAAGPLAVLDEFEVAAIIGHELAHFTGGDTAYSQQFLPIYGGIMRNLDAVAIGLRPIRRGGLPLRAAMMLGYRMLEAFHGAVTRWGRLREFEADKASAMAVAPAAAASALLRSSAVAPLVDYVLAAGAAHPEMATDMIAEIFDRAETGLLPDPSRYLDARQAHPFDTHPPTCERIAALGVEVDDALLTRAARSTGPEEAAFADNLFVDWSGLRKLLSADALAVAGYNRQQKRTALKAVITAAEDITEVHEAALLPSLLGMLGFGIAGLLLGAIFFVGGIVDLPGEGSLLMLLLGCIFLTAGIVSCSGIVLALRNARRGAIMTLRLAGLEIRGMAGIIPWTVIRDVRLSWRSTVTVRFDFSPGAELPLCGGWPRRVRVDRRKRILILSGLRPSRIKPMELIALLTRYRQGSAAAFSLATQD